MLKILFIGDIYGKLGRETVKKLLPKIKAEEKPDFVIANIENSAHGSGVSLETANELLSYGVNFCTTGDHAFDNAAQFVDCVEAGLPIIRPANFPEGVPGVGYKNIKVGKHNILVINLVGRVFMHMDYDCPFRKLDEILKENLANLKPSAIIIDMHAEATSEKVSFGHYADGRASAVFGTHTHVMTADERILSGGTAYLSDAGMVGARNECIGIGKENTIKTFLTQMRTPKIILDTGPSQLSSVLVTIDTKTGKAVKVKRIVKNINIT